MSLDPNLKILIVDDSTAIRYVHRQILNNLGFRNIVEAEDGQVALRRLRAELFDLILADWNMPNMTGLELTKIIRATPELKHIPILMVTAEGQQEYVIAAIRAGVTNYVIKPFNAQIIQQKILATLGSS